MAEIDTLRIKPAFVYSGFAPSFTKSSSTYNDLVNSGNLKIFNDLEFKKILDKYYYQIDWTLQFDKRIRETMWYDYRDELIKHIDPLIFRSVYKDMYKEEESDYKIDQIDLAQFAVEWELVKNSTDLNKQLRLILAYRVLLRGGFNNAIEKVDNILNYIQSTELK